MVGFKKELKILKKIKSLELEENGGFPIIISAKISKSLGEIMMTFCGKDIFEEFELQKSLEDDNYHKKFTL
jgi:hypothetical protein